MANRTPALLAAAGWREACQQTGLTGAAITYKDDGLGPGNIGALGQFLDLLRA